MDWDEMHERAEDRQPSGGKIHRGMGRPFYKTILEVRDDYGKIIGLLVIEEFMETEWLPMSERKFRVAIFEQEPVNKPEPKKFKLRFEQGPFPDED